MSSAPHEVYSRCLPGAHGYPLWTPELKIQLRENYQLEGLKIGDVGIVSPNDGSFDVLFNITLPHSEQPYPRLVREDFTPIILDPEADLATQPRAVSVHGVISSESVELISQEIHGCDQRPSRANYEFGLSMEDGAVLILPEGAQSCDLVNEKTFLDEAIRHGINWYACATERAGRLINNDSLYLITGFHKTRSWSLGAAGRSGSSLQNRRSVKFKVEQIHQDSDPAAAYIWSAAHGFTGRVGPLSEIPDRVLDGRVRRTANQAVFIRGFRITVNKLLFLKTISVETRQGTFGGLGTYVNSLLWGRPSDSTHSSGTENATDNTVDQDSSENHGRLYTGSRLTIDRMQDVSQTFHPGDSINQYMLKKEPRAMVALTHDSLWIEILQMGLLELADFSREKRLEEILSKNYRLIVEDGAVCLRKGDSHVLESLPHQPSEWKPQSSSPTGSVPTPGVSDLYPERAEEEQAKDEALAAGDPPLYPTSIPLPVVGPSPSPPPPESGAFEAMPTPDQKDFELALTLSASEARKREQELIAQEEEELARALEESRLLSDSIYILDAQSSTSSTFLKPLSMDRASTSAIKASAHPPEGKSWLHSMTPTSSSLSDDLPSSHSSASQEVSDDDLSDPSRGVNDVQTPYITRDASPTPLYANVVSNLIRNPLPTLSPSHSAVAPISPSATSFAHLQNDPPSDRVPTSPSLSLASSEQLQMPSFISRPSWSSASSENGTSTGHSLGSDLVPTSSGYKSPTHPSLSPDLSPAPTNLDPLDERAEGEADTEPGPSTRPAIRLSANQYVEREMLMGVSLGFNFPVISTELLPMTNAMPNVITLPYGKAPVFHFQAPGWRKLLKLMARLSATRVEPTIEAISVAKHDLKLRTVIQFVKIHHSASEWRTVLYLTTDYPVPSNLPNSYKFTNGDVSVLPYSYSLSPLPTLLRDGPESSMVKYYVVPSTPSTPYPNLPINFPNLAMYLQSAVQDSRRAANDSSSGLRKLAQYIDSCYQTESERVAPIDPEVASKRGVGGMFKRVMGGHGANKNSGGNDEIYDLVTPFASDEWG